MSKTFLGSTIWLPSYHCLLPRFHGPLWTYSSSLSTAPTKLPFLRDGIFDQFHQPCYHIIVLLILSIVTLPRRSCPRGVSIVRLTIRLNAFVYQIFSYFAVLELLLDFLERTPSPTASLSLLLDVLHLCGYLAISPCVVSHIVVLYCDFLDISTRLPWLSSHVFCVVVCIVFLSSFLPFTL